MKLPTTKRYQTSMHYSKFQQPQKNRTQNHFKKTIKHPNKHLNPKPLVITERFWFHKRDQNKVKRSCNELHFEGIPNVNHVINLYLMLNQYNIKFADGIGNINDIQAHFTLKGTSKASFFKECSVNYVMQPIIEKELDRIQHNVVIQHAAFSN